MFLKKTSHSNAITSSIGDEIVQKFVSFLGLKEQHVASATQGGLNDDEN